MRIAIVGSGAVGCYFGGRLAAAGGDVSFIARGAQLAALQTGGLTIESPLGNVRLPDVRATHDPADIGPVDVVLFAVKLYDTEGALPLLPPLIGPSTLVVPLQNGVESIDRLAAAIGKAHVVGGSAYVTAVLAEPGLVRHSAMDRIIFGPVSGSPAPALEELARLGRHAGFDATLTDRVHVEIWSKFVRLTVFSAMTSITRCPIGPLRSDPELRAIMETAWHEAIHVARAKQVPLPATIFGDIVTAINALPPGAKSSMLEDLERGRRLELPWLSGAVVRIGEEVGVDTPTHRLFTALLTPHVEGH